jgi:hypothetical protein
MMAGLVATLAGTEMNIWTFVGFVPKPVTCWRAPIAGAARADKPYKHVETFMLAEYLCFRMQ